MLVVLVVLVTVDVYCIVLCCVDHLFVCFKSLISSPFDSHARNNINNNNNPKPSVDLTHFNMLKVVGKGGFGKVNAAEDLKTHELCAIKTIKKVRILSNRHYLSTVWFERDLTSQFSRQGFLVNLLFAFQDERNLYLVMPFMAGGDLRYYLNTVGVMSEMTMRFYAAELVLALEELHGLKFVYR